MRFRIAMWAMVGLAVAAGWALYAYATFPDLIQAKPLLWNLALLTQPVALASMSFHFPVSIYWVFLANAVTYAILGLMVETVRRQSSHAK